ncbi:MAG: tRNA pseudouridine(38-40) synthase TruA [Candidatus Omnitrophota bacterium]
MRNLKIILEYDGGSFFGFQRQPGRATVQEVLEDALSRLFNTKVKIGAASGRTDTGVHALAQVVHAKVSTSMPLEKIRRGLNAILPRTMAVRKAEWAPPGFHARYGARSKLYEYRIWNAEVRSPLGGERMWHIAQPLDLPRMRKAARDLVGRRDFRSFCAAISAHKRTVRHLKKLKIAQKGKVVIFQAEADGFLHHMVRNIVGTLVEVGRGKILPSRVRGILRGRDRRLAGPTAPACGLFLVRVTYGRG